MERASQLVIMLEVIILEVIKVFNEVEKRYDIVDQKSSKKKENHGKYCLIFVKEGLLSTSRRTTTINIQRHIFRGCHEFLNPTDSHKYRFEQRKGLPMLS